MLQERRCHIQQESGDMENMSQLFFNIRKRDRSDSSETRQETDQNKWQGPVQTEELYTTVWLYFI